MTNEEKALEAARVIKEEIGMSEHSIPRVAEIIDWCLTWKDQQFKEYLEKKKAEYLSRRDDADMWSEQWGVYHALACTTHQTINELFGGE